MERMKKQELIDLINTLKVDREEFWVVSSGGLTIRELLPDAGDLDIAITDKGFEQIKKQFDVKHKIDNWYTVNELIECVCIGKREDIKFQPEMIDGIQVQDIEEYAKFLYKSDREKDIARIPIVNEYIKNRPEHMKYLKYIDNEIIVKLIENGVAGAADLTDSGICPTCFNNANNSILYGDAESKLLYEDDLIECFLVGNPRANGHAAISTKTHYKDMMDIDDELCKHVFLVSKKLMNIIREVYGSESVYLCTMCDGPMNHFHVQLIPRYKEEKRGSKNFVKPRFDYVEDLDKLEKVRKLMK